MFCIPACQAQVVDYTHTAYAFKAMTVLRAQDITLVMTIRASDDISE